MKSPGPGAYDANKNAIKDKTPNVFFSGQKRKSVFAKDNSSNLGPGVYDVNPKKSGPSFSFGSKVSLKYK